MFKEIQEGERQLSETETDVQNLRSLLGLGTKPIGLPEETPKTTRPPGKVGKRKPKRDPIGVQQDVS
jgi:hypothetical protein